jgi:hypothetical protein
MSNRLFKKQLWNENPYCHWCGCLTQLTNCANGIIPNDAATLDHLISRFNPARWIKRKPGERRKVLACYACNQRRSIEEHERLSKAEISRRSHGFSLNPLGKPYIINDTFDTVEEVILFLKEKGVDISFLCVKVTT